MLDVIETAIKNDRLLFGVFLPAMKKDSIAKTTCIKTAGTSTWIIDIPASLNSSLKVLAYPRAIFVVVFEPIIDPMLPNALVKAG